MDEREHAAPLPHDREPALLERRLELGPVRVPGAGPVEEPVPEDEPVDAVGAGHAPLEVKRGLHGGGEGAVAGAPNGRLVLVLDRTSGRRVDERDALRHDPPGSGRTRSLDEVVRALRP